MKLPSEIEERGGFELPTHRQSKNSIVTPPVPKSNLNEPGLPHKTTECTSLMEDKAASVSEVASMELIGLNKNEVPIREQIEPINETQKRKKLLRISSDNLSIDEAEKKIESPTSGFNSKTEEAPKSSESVQPNLIDKDTKEILFNPILEDSAMHEPKLLGNSKPQNTLGKADDILNPTKTKFSHNVLRSRCKGYLNNITLVMSKTYNLCVIVVFLSLIIEINRLKDLRDLYFILVSQVLFIAYLVIKRVLLSQKSLFEETMLFFIFFIGLNQLMNMTDLEFKEWFYYNLTSSTIANFCAFLIIVGIEIHILAGYLLGIINSIKKLWEPKSESEPTSSIIPEPPDFTEELCITVGEVHCPETGKRQKKASLITIPEKGLYTNLFVFGSIGSGKTVFLLSILQQILSYKKHTKELKPCGLFIDEKGNLGSQVMEIAKGIGRDEDVYVFDLSGNVIWNVIHEPSKGADAIARRLEKIMESSVEKSADWIRKYAYEFLVNIIKLIRLTSPDYYITLKDIHEHIHDEEKIKSKLKILNEDKYEIVEKLSKMETDIRQIKNLDLKNYIDEEYKIIHTYFTKSWFLLKGKDPEVFGYISTSLSQLVGPVIDPKIAYIFNPDHPSKINFKGFDWIINEGKLFVYSVPDSIYEGLGKYIALFMKLPFQKACLSRIPKTTKGTEVYDPNYNKDRPILFVADENQNSYHPSDNNAIDKLREAKVIHICLSQTFVSLLAQKHNEAGVLQYLGSFRNKLFLSTDDPKSAEYYSKIVGQELKKNKSVSYSESSKDASVNLLQNNVVNSETNLSKSVNFQDRLENRFGYTKFIDLKMFQGIFTGFSGNMKIAAQYVYVKPYWVNWKKDYFTYIKEM